MRTKSALLLILLLLGLVPASRRLGPNPSLRYFLAASYLLRQYNPSLGLIYESDDPGTHWLVAADPPVSNARYDSTYWLYSDNLFAYHALRRYAPSISRTIEETIAGYGVPSSNLFEVLFGADIPDTIFDARNLVVADDGECLVMIRRHDDEWKVIVSDYADMLLYQALDAHFEGKEKAARRYFRAAYAMYDGKGLKDESVAVDGFYANYKLSLLLYAAKVLGIPLPDFNAIEARLWAMQQPDGGIASLASLQGEGMGSSNVETTSLALLVYEDDLIRRLREHRSQPAVQHRP